MFSGPLEKNSNPSLHNPWMIHTIISPSNHSTLHYFQILTSNEDSSLLSCPSSHWPVLWLTLRHGLGWCCQFYYYYVFTLWSGPMLCLHRPVWAGTGCGGAKYPLTGPWHLCSSYPAATAAQLLGNKVWLRLMIIHYKVEMRLSSRPGLFLEA